MGNARSCCQCATLPKRFYSASKLTKLIELSALNGIDVELLDPKLWKLYELERSSEKGSCDVDKDYRERNRLSRKYRRNGAKLNVGLILKFAVTSLGRFLCLCVFRAAAMLALEQHITWKMEEPRIPPNTYRKRSKRIAWITNCCKLLLVLQRKRVTDSPKKVASGQIERSKKTQ